MVRIFEVTLDQRHLTGEHQLLLLGTDSIPNLLSFERADRFLSAKDLNLADLLQFLILLW